MNQNEIYVGKRDKEFIERRIDALCEKYNNRHGPNIVMQRALLRSYCRDTLLAFDECFETSLLGISRCVRKVEAYQKNDAVEIRDAMWDIARMLLDLKCVVRDMVAIKDLPSCKKLIELSPEDIAAKAKDLVHNETVKVGITGALLGLKIGDIVSIQDVRHYYHRLLSELKREVEEKGEPMSAIEQFLSDKFNAEIAYCNEAIFKAGLGITEELKKLVEIGREHIKRYEAQIGNGGEIAPFSQMEERAGVLLP